jgi:hypothetical protein
MLRARPLPGPAWPANEPTHATGPGSCADNYHPFTVIKYEQVGTAATTITAFRFFSSLKWNISWPADTYMEQTRERYFYKTVRYAAAAIITTSSFFHYFKFFLDRRRADAYNKTAQCISEPDGISSAVTISPPGPWAADTYCAKEKSKSKNRTPQPLKLRPPPLLLEIVLGLRLLIHTWNQTAKGIPARLYATQPQR